MSVRTHSVPAGICEFADDRFAKSTLWALHFHCWANLRTEIYNIMTFHAKHLSQIEINLNRIQ